MSKVKELVSVVTKLFYPTKKNEESSKKKGDEEEYVQRIIKIGM